MKRITWCLVALVWASPCYAALAPEPPLPEPPLPEPPRPASPLEQIVSAVEAMAKSDVAASRAFAWELTKTLARHRKSLAECKVKLPRTLLALEDSPRPAPGKLSEADLDFACEQTRSVVRAAGQWDPDRRPEDAVPPGLWVDLLATVASACPSAVARVESAYLLAGPCHPDQEAKAPAAKSLTPAAGARAIRDALAYALDGLAKGPSEHAARGLGGACAVGLVRMYLVLAALASDAPAKEDLDERLGELAAKVEAARRADHSERTKETLDRVAKRLETFKSQTRQIAQVAATRKAVENVVREFLTAVNTENRKKALECLTAKAAEVFAKSESLRAAFSGRDDTKDILYRGIGPIGEVNGRKDVIVLYRIVDKARRLSDAARQMPLAETEKGWLLGER